MSRVRVDGRLLAAGVVALAVIVAAVAPVDGVLTMGLALDEESQRNVRVGGLLAIAVGAVGLALQRRRIREDDPRAGDPAAAGLGIAAGLIVALALVGSLNPAASLDRPDTRSGAQGGPEFGRGSPLPGNPQEDVTDGGASMARGERMEREMLPGVENAGAGEEPALRRVGRQIATSFLLLLAALALWRLLARTVGLGVTTADPVEPDEEADAGPGVPPPPDHRARLDRLLAELRAGGTSPSRTVQLAYEALLAALAAVGAERETQEAPHEHLRRTIGGLGIARTPPHRLAGLHVADRFGSTPATEDDERDARTSLEHALNDLGGRVGPAAP